MWFKNTFLERQVIQRVYNIAYDTESTKEPFD